MPRKRDVDPARWTTERSLALSWGADHFLVGLTNFTDDEGRIEWSPRQLRARICPRDDVSLEQVEGWMAEIAEQRIYLLYEVDGRTYGVDPEFADDQYINRPQQSKLPAPPNSLINHGTRSEHAWKAHELFPPRALTGSESGTESVSGDSPGGSTPNGVSPPSESLRRNGSKPEKPKRWTPEADELAKELWPQIVNRPVARSGAGFVVVRERIQECLDAGRIPAELRLALPKCSVWSQRGVETALTRELGADTAALAWARQRTSEG